MSNNEKYIQIFTDTFSLEEKELNETTTMENIELWDSVGHVNLVVSVEETFGVELTMEDMSEFISFEAGKEILRKYGIEI